MKDDLVKDYLQQKDNTASTASKNSDVQIYHPCKNSTHFSPLMVVLEMLYVEPNPFFTTSFTLSKMSRHFCSLGQFT